MGCSMRILQCDQQVLQKWDDPLTTSALTTKKEEVRQRRGKVLGKQSSASSHANKEGAALRSWRSVLLVRLEDLPLAY